MKRKSQSILALAITLLTLFTACGKRDKVVNVEDNDPEMVAAISKARDTLPQFWTTFDNHSHGETGFALKVKITDKHGTEHFWATDIQKQDGKITGRLDNDPNIVTTVKMGQRIQVPEDDISDWFYMRDGKMVGNQTLKPLLKSMPPDEAAKLKSIMVEP